MTSLVTPTTLTGGRIQPRPFREDDLDALWAMLNDEEVNQPTGTHASFPREAVERWYRSRDGQADRLDLAAVTIADDRCVGEVVLHELDADNRSCGFRISLRGPHVYGRGYGTEATRLMLSHAFDKAGLHRVGLEVCTCNTRAFHVYRRAGFSVDGVRREALWWVGAFHDAVLMSLLAHEWRAARHLSTPPTPPWKQHASR